ncbi:immunoglobulin-like domain-containing protein, partial [Listeria fleischmannii]
EATTANGKKIQSHNRKLITLIPITAGDRIITGKVDPSNKAVQIGSKALNSSGFNYGTEFDANGNFSTQINADLPVGDLVTANFSSAAGDEALKYYRVGGGTYNQTMSLNPMTVESTELVGKALPYSWVTLTINGSSYYSGFVADGQGNFSRSVQDITGKSTFPAGTTITVAYENAGVSNIADAEVSAHGQDTKTIVIQDNADKTAPVITASNKSLKVGDSFNPLTGVSATDDKDGNLTSKIKVTSNNVDTSKPGVYQVVYSVADAAGNTATKTITVTVTSNDKPVISGAVNKTITQGTSFDPKAGVTATDTEDGNLTSAITVSGTVNTNVPGSYPITYTVKDSDGNTTTKSITITVQAKATQGTVTANDFNIGKDSYITGTYTGDVKKLSVIVNGKTLSTINVSGSPYKYYAGKNITGVNDVVQVVGYDADGKELSRATVTVKKEIITEGTITANNFVIGKDGYVKGNTTGDVAKISMIVNGKEFSRINATAGAYQYYAGGKILTANDAVTMVAYDAKGKELDRANVAVSKDDAPEVGTITTNTFTIGQDGYVTGTFTGKAARLGLLINGQELSRINVTTSPFKYYVGSKIASTNDDVTAVLYDAKGREMARSNVTLKKAEPVTSGTVAADAFQVGGTDAYIHGTTTGDVVKVKLSVNGTIISQRAVNADGSYDYYARPSITSTNDVVYMIGYDAKGKELNRVKVALTSAKGTVSASPYTVGGADRYLHGTATGDVAKVQVYINGQQDSLTVVKADGTFQYYLSSKVTSTNDKVEVVGLSNNGQELDRAVVTLN